jgi:hypothetical protein
LLPPQGFLSKVGVDGMKNFEIELFIVLISNNNGIYDLPEQLFFNPVCSYMKGYVFHFLYEFSRYEQVSVKNKKLRTKGDGNSLVTILKTMELAGAVNKDGSAFLQKSGNIHHSGYVPEHFPVSPYQDGLIRHHHSPRRFSGGPRLLDQLLGKLSA